MFIVIAGAGAAHIHQQLDDRVFRHTDHMRRRADAVGFHKGGDDSDPVGLVELVHVFIVPRQYDVSSMGLIL